MLGVEIKTNLYWPMHGMWCKYISEGIRNLCRKTSRKLYIIMYCNRNKLYVWNGETTNIMNKIKLISIICNKYIFCRNGIFRFQGQNKAVSIRRLWSRISTKLGNNENWRFNFYFTLNNIICPFQECNYKVNV